MPSPPLADSQFPAELTEAELAQLAAYDTAPENDSPFYKHFDDEAKRAQKGWRWLFRGSAFLLLFVSISSAITGLGPWLLAQQWLPATRPPADRLRLLDGTGVSLTLFALALEVGLQWYWRRQLQPWALTRDRAEILRGMVWRYLLNMPLVDYPTASQLGASTDGDWQRMMRDFASAVTPAVSGLTTEVHPRLKYWRQRFHALSPAGRLQAYATGRLATQHNYFAKRAGELTASARWWSRMGYGLLLLALVWNGVRLVAIVQNWPLTMTFFNFNFSLVLIGGVALVKAYTETEDFEPLAARYRRMAGELQQRQASVPSAPVSEVELRQVVLATEQLLRDETSEWTVRRSGEQPARAGSHLYIGFVGKRRLPGGDEPLRATLETVLASLEQEFVGQSLVGVSALALGADTVFAEACARHAAAKPAYTQLIMLPASPADFFLPADFRLSDTEPETAISGRLVRALACLHGPAVQEVRFPSRSPDRDERFAETAFAIANQADLLVVACTRQDREDALADPPKPDLARGGSAETLHYAHQQGKRIILIEVDAELTAAGRLPIAPLAAE